jgi:hypothetical protein
LFHPQTGSAGRSAGKSPFFTRVPAFTFQRLVARINAPVLDLNLLPRKGLVATFLQTVKADLQNRSPDFASVLYAKRSVAHAAWIGGARNVPESEARRMER